MTRLNRAVQILKEKDVSCVIINGQEEVSTSTELGIKPLMIALRKDKHAFKGCVIADRIIGKAAALLAVLGKAEGVYGEIMSEAGKEVLEIYQKTYAFGTMVPYIHNRSNTGRCPMEEAVCEEKNPERAFVILEETISELMKQKSK